MVSVKVMVENDTLNKYRKMNSKTVVWISIETTRPVKEGIEWLSRGHHHCLHHHW